MKIVKGAKSIDRIIRQVKSSKKKKPSAQSAESEISNLIQLQREAVQAAIEESAIKPVGAIKGIRAAEKVQEEYQVAKTGVRSRIGKFAKVLGAGEKEAATLEMLFGKKVPEDELKKLREKFKIKTPEEVEKEKQEAEQLKARKAEEKVERGKKRDEAVFKIEKLSEQIFDLVTTVQKTIQGIANKVGAEESKDIKITKGKYFDQSGKQLKKSEVEKGSGVTYSRKTGRFKDVKTGKFVSEKVARQRMNISPKAVRAVPGMAAGAAIAASAGLASKVLQKEEAAPVDDTGKKIDQLSKKVDGVNKGISSILDIFSLKKFYGLIGGAIGAAIPLLKKAVEWVWNFAQTGWQWVKDVASTIGDWLKETLLKIKFTIPGVEAFGRKLWDPITIQPFSFLKSEQTVQGSQPVEETAPPPKPAGGEAGAAPVTPAPAPAPMAPAPAPAPAPAAQQGGASRAGTSMPAAAPPVGGGGTFAGGGATGGWGGEISPSSGKGAAIAAADKYGITGAHKAQFLAQLDHESGGFKRLEENLNYSAKRLRQVFPKYYKTDEEAQADERQPMKIANKVYGNRMGNSQPGDGYKYRGRGLIQLTGKNNYSMFGKIIGMDLVSNPDAASSLGTAADIAAAFYKKNVMDKGIDGSDTKAVTKAINGGSHGLSDRATKFASYMKSPETMQGAPALGGPEGPMLAQTAPPEIQQASGGAAPATETAAQPMLAAAPAAPASIPATATPVTPTPASGYAVAADSTAVSAAKEQMVAAAPAPSFVPVPVGSAPSPATVMPSGSAVKASARAAEDSFVRALAKDFAHPSAFTTIGTV